MTDLNDDELTVLHGTRVLLEAHRQGLINHEDPWELTEDGRQQLAAAYAAGWTPDWVRTVDYLLDSSDPAMSTHQRLQAVSRLRPVHDALEPI